MADVYPLLVAERQRLADVLDTLHDEQWNSASLCAGWTVRDVVAHLVFPTTTSTFRVLIPLAKARFDFGRMTTETARADRRSGSELTAALRKTATHRFTPPGFGFEAPLTDVVVHGRDIGRPLGLPPGFEAQSARAVLDFVTSKKATRANAFVRRATTDGLRFEATDLNWGYGDGDAVRGPAEALILAVVGRSVALDDLSGPGVATLDARLS